MLSEKRCYKCSQTKPAPEFARSNTSRDGLQSMCKKCNKERHDAKRDEHRPNRIKRGSAYVMPSEKKCTKCLEVKPIDHFALREDGRRPRARCRECQVASQEEWRKNNPHASRQANIRYKYGLTKEQYDVMVEAQNGVCGICEQPETSQRSLFLSVDHCHITGKIRGLLCRRCNSALGQLEDDTERMRKMIQWVEAHQTT